MPILTFLGHSAFTLKTGDHLLLFDPFISGNPLAVNRPDDISPDFILVTHAHGDHIGDTIKIAQKSDALVISTFEIAQYLSRKGIRTHGLHIGGGYSFPFGYVKLTIAIHGNAIPLEDGSLLALGGPPCGFLVTVEDKTVYHSGDTGLFYDMKLIGEMNQIDVALLPIGDNYTMGITDAIKAAEFLQPKISIPMHYDTFEIIRVDPKHFLHQLVDQGLQGLILKPGENYEF